VDSALLVGRYRLIKVLGQGTMGQVSMAQDEVLDRRVAIKSLHTLSPDVGLVDRMMREARLAARLSHPNAVGVYDLVVVDERPYLVMEYVPGESLAHLLERQPELPPGVVARIGSQVASALAAAHHLGIVHRDVKPANILLAPDGTVKLADFGIARADGNPELTQTGQVLGSIAYMPAEVARGELATPAADVWALGATMYRAVQGRLLFDGDHTLVYLGQLLNQDIPRPTRAGPLTPTLNAMLDPDPARRPSAAVASADLSRVREPDGFDAAATATIRRLDPPPPLITAPARLASTSAPPIGAATTRSARRRMTIIGAAGAAVVVVAVISAVVLTAGKSKSAVQGNAHIGSIADAVGNTSNRSVSGNADITSVAWRPAADAMQYTLTFADPIDVSKTEVAINFDTDRNPLSGYMGVDCAHDDQARMGVDYFVGSDPDSTVGGKMGTECTLSFGEQKITRKSTANTIVLTVANSAFPDQQGDCHVKFVTETIRDAATSDSTGPQDIVPAIGQAPLSIAC
jgi:serine/threonine protein kinase